MTPQLAEQLDAQTDGTVESSCKPRRALRREGQPMYTEARGRHWEIWIKVAPKGKRRRVRTWIPVKRHPVTGALLNGELALSVYNTVARLWECPHPRWYVLQATADEGENGALQRLHDAVVESGLAGADVLAASLEDRAQTASGHVDLVPLVEEWEVSAPTRQRGKGSISATTRLLMVSRVLKLFSPELLAWRTTRSLAIRDDRPIPPKPNVTPFLLADFTWAKIHEHLAKSYRAKPTEEQREALAHKDPIRRELTEAALQGQGAGALAAFTAFAVFARWLVASGVIAVDPTEGEPRPADSPPDLAYLDNHEDIERIATRLAAPLDDIWRVMCGTGIEPSPALVLPVEKAEVLATPVLHAHGTKSASRKRNAEYGDRTGQAVERARADAVRNGRPTLFPARDEKGRQITRYLLAKEIRRASDVLVADHPQFAGIHLYSARHTFAVMAIKGGASYQEVAQQLGHTTVAMVIRRYGRYKSAPGRIAAAMNSHGSAEVPGPAVGQTTREA